MKEKCNKIKKIVMVEPKAPDIHIFSFKPLPRLGTIILGTIMKERGYDVTIVVEEIHPLKDEIFDGVDLAGISTTTSTATGAYSLADKLRARGIIVVMGGPHVTFMPEEAILHADYVVMGEGEEVFPSLVEKLDRQEKIYPAPGLAVRGEEISYSHYPLLDDLDKIPIPDFSLVKGMKPCYNTSRKETIPVQASRGCPFACNFCSVTGMFGTKFRHKSISRVMEEVERYNTKKHHIFFYDDNLAADKRWLKNLLNEFIKNKMKFPWSAQVRVDIYKDEELLDLMVESHCKNLSIGFESINPDTLININKRQTEEEIKEGVSVFEKKKISVHGMFVFGFDTDTVESLEKTVLFAKDSGINTVQFLILTPLPDTKSYNDLRRDERIFFNDWSYYDGHHVTFWPEHMDPLLLQKIQIKGHADFYSFNRLLKKVITTHFGDAAIYAYAKNINRLWQRSNKLFMKSLDFISQSGKSSADNQVYHTI